MSHDSHLPPRKKVKPYDNGEPHILTFSCYRRLPLLSKDHSRQWLVEAKMSQIMNRRRCGWSDSFLLEVLLGETTELPLALAKQWHRTWTSGGCATPPRQLRSAVRGRRGDNECARVGCL